MSTTTITDDAAGDHLAHRSTIGWAVQDALAIAHRNLIGLLRTPTTLVFSTIQPVMFVLMFRYVFGGSIQIQGFRYVDYLMAGIFVQTVTFGSINTGIGLADDLSTGLIERFRSLAMARSAVLAGRTLADAVRNLIVILLMITVGFLVGFQLYTNVLGLQTRTMPGPLRAFAEHQPVTATVDAVRAPLNGGPTAGKVFASLAWSLAVVAVFAPLAVRRYRRAA